MNTGSTISDLPIVSAPISTEHSTHMIGGGMVFPRKLKDIHDFIRAVLDKEAVELLDGCQSE